MADEARDRVRAAAAAQIGALLLDRDVSGAHALEGGTLDVMRRGRRERLDVTLDDELWQALRAVGAAEGPVVVELSPHRVHAAPVAGGRLLLHLEKDAPADPRMQDLVEERVLPAEAALDVVRATLAGDGLIVVGPVRAVAQRLAIATARELAEHAPVMALGGISASWLLPAPANDDATARARAAIDLGAELLLAPALSVDEFVALAHARLPVPLIAAVAVANAAQLYAAVAQAGDDVTADAVLAHVCVIGREPGGRAVLLEQHAASVRPTSPSAAAPLPVAHAASPSSALPSSPGVPMALPPAAVRPGSFANAEELPPLPPLPSGPPADWATNSPEGDPGWELTDPAEFGEEDTPVGAFDAVLSSVKNRPSYQPRPPPSHPQTRQLQGDPLGGLTLEPPSGGDDDEEGDEGAR